MRSSELKIVYQKLFLLLFLILLPTVLMAQSRVIEERSFDVNKGQTIKVDAEGADVNIDSWAENRVEVKVFGNRKAEDKLDIDFYQDSDGVEVVVERHGSFFSGWFSSIQCKVEIKVPMDFNARVKTSGGDISLFELNGNLEMKTSGGDITTSETKGELNLKTSGGDIEVKDQEGESLLGTSGGDIKVSNTSGNIDAQTSGGDIELDVNNGEVEAGTSGGDVRVVYDGENKGIDLRTSGGDVTLKVNSDFKADVYLTASGGRVYCELDATKVYRDSKRKFEGEINGGGPRVYCKTSGGDVEVK